MPGLPILDRLSAGEERAVASLLFIQEKGMTFQMCPDINTCHKIQLVLDKDLDGDWQYARVIEEICSRCETYASLTKPRCPIKLHPIHCPNCHFNPTGEKCEYAEITQTREKRRP